MLTVSKIFVIAGEASGDAHAGRMISQLKQLNPSIQVRGIGGDNMRAAGAEIDTDFSQLAVMGLLEVIKKYRQIKKIFNQTLETLKKDRPDLLVLVDYPGFNLKLAKQAKKLGIPVLYYISPKIWAWRAGRIKTIKQVVVQMAVLFPFEVPIYEKESIPVNCVGHPLVDAVKRTLTTEQAKMQFELDPTRRVVGLFPGSRHSEVNNLLPIMIKAAEKASQRYGDIDIVMPMAPGLDKTVVDPILAESKINIKVIEGDFYELTSACDAIIAASGTVTLEIALLGVPHFITYRVAPLSYKILSRFILIPYVGLCNIVTGQNVIKELLQNDVTVEGLDKELSAMLDDLNSKEKAKIIRQQVLTALGPSGGAKNVAQQILTMLEQK